MGCFIAFIITTKGCAVNASFRRIFALKNEKAPSGRLLRRGKAFFLKQGCKAGLASLPPRKGDSRRFGAKKGSPFGRGLGIPESPTSSPEAPLLGATATTAASGGNREELLGQRPAGCERQRSRRWEPQPGLGERSETERLDEGQPDREPQRKKPLRQCFALPPPLSRGGLGMSGNSALDAESSI